MTTGVFFSASNVICTALSSYASWPVAGRRLVFHFNIRRDAVIFHFPLTVQAWTSSARAARANSRSHYRICRATSSRPPVVAKNPDR
jgi:hypothetical protein